MALFVTVSSAVVQFMCQVCCAVFSGVQTAVDSDILYLTSHIPRHMLWGVGVHVPVSLHNLWVFFSWKCCSGTAFNAVERRVGIREGYLPWALGPCSFLSNFWSARHVALCWLMECTMTWVGFHPANECDLPHMIAAEVAHCRCLFWRFCLLNSLSIL